MQMIAVIAAFLDEHADQLTPKQQELAAVFLLEYVGKRSVSLAGLMEKFERVDIKVYWKRPGANIRGEWRVKFK